MSNEPLSDLEHLELAKSIAAAKRGEGPMPDLALLRRAVDSIRTKRIAFVANAPKRGSASAPGKANTVRDISFDDLGF